MNLVPENRCADLHLHTCFSDGTYSPAELVTQAHAQELQALALTGKEGAAKAMKRALWRWANLPKLRTVWGFSDLESQISNSESDPHPGPPPEYRGRG